MKNVRTLSIDTIDLFEGEGYVNRVIEQYELRQRLAAHGNIFQIEDYILYIQDEDGKFTINTTGWTLFDLLDFLNY